MGVWPDAYYVTYNMFGNPQGARVAAFERDKMLTGAPAREVAVQLTPTYFSLLPSDFDGMPDAQHLPPNGSPAFFLSLGTNPNSLDLWKFRVDWNNPANSKFGGPGGVPDKTLSVAPYADAPSQNAIPQLNTTQKLDGLGDRLMYRLAYRRFGDHEALVVNHSVAASAVAAPRWYEIRDPAGNPTVFQQGTLSPDSTSRWMGSVAMDGTGSLAMGYSASSSNSHPGIRLAARLAGTSPGMLGAEAMAADSKSSQDGASRWGDYSSMSVDPTDDSTFWFTTEYLTDPQNGVFNWSTRIIAFKVASVATPASGGHQSSTDGKHHLNTPMDTSGIHGVAVSAPAHAVQKPGEATTTPVANAVVVVRSSDNREVARVTTDKDGKFRVHLPPGEYTLVPSPPDRASRYPKADPQTIKVSSGKMEDIKIEYDSGIR
jgi:hypothetical protein